MTWQLPFDRLRVNAALSALTEQFDKTAARDVIIAFQGLPAEKRNHSEWWSPGSSSTSQQGLTSIGKNVDIPDEGATIIRRGGPQHEQRVGEFRVFRSNGHHHSAIVFRPFWASDESTMVHPTCEWHLHYRVESWEPLALVRADWIQTEVAWWRHLESLLHCIRNGRFVKTVFWIQEFTPLFLAEGFSLR